MNNKWIYFYFAIALVNTFIWAGKEQSMSTDYKKTVIDKVNLTEEEFYNYTEDVSDTISEIMIENDRICGIGIKTINIADIAKNKKIPFLFCATFNDIRMSEIDPQRNYQ